MEQYKTLAKELIEQHIKDTQSWDKTAKRKDILIKLADGETEDIFGNITGSRTCSTNEAEQFISKSNAIFDEDIIDLYNEISEGYMADTLKRGAEAFDVITLELVAPQVISELQNDIMANLEQ